MDETDMISSGILSVILVVYVNVSGIDEDKVKSYIQQYREDYINKVIKDSKLLCFVIPTVETFTQVVCIHPSSISLKD